MVSWYQDPFFVRNLTFGIEDSLISTTGVLVGIAAANFNVKHIIVTGIILIIIEASSMAYGAFLSENNFFHTSNTERTTADISKYAVVMFVSYFIVGVFLLLPFAMKVPYPIPTVLGIAWCMLASLIVFFERDKKKALHLTILGGMLMLLSVWIGKNLKT